MVLKITLAHPVALQSEPKPRGSGLPSGMLVQEDVHRHLGTLSALEFCKGSSSLGFCFLLWHTPHTQQQWQLAWVCRVRSVKPVI